MWHAKNDWVELFVSALIRSFSNEGIDCNCDGLRALWTVALMSRKFLLHERFHHLRAHKKLQCLDLLRVGDFFPCDSLKSLVTPQTLILTRNVFELDGCTAAVGILQVLVDVHDPVALLVERGWHSVVQFEHVEAVKLIELPVLHLRCRVFLSTIS